MKVTIIRPSSMELPDKMPGVMPELSAQGFDCDYSAPKLHAQWPYTAGSAPDRAKAFQQAFIERDAPIIWAARGGYGAADILPIIDWPAIAPHAQAKTLVGCSDISALQSALYAKFGFPALHASMPASQYWHIEHPAIKQTLQVLLGSDNIVSLPVCQSNTNKEVQGILFGGCLSVLCQLMGTEYFPSNLKGHLLFVEDIGESIPRILRMMQQLVMGGVMEQLNGIVLGYFKQLSSQSHDETDNQLLFELLQQRYKIPIFQSLSFGHTNDNYPLMIGAPAVVNPTELRWSIFTHSGIQSKQNVTSQSEPSKS